MHAPARRWCPAPVPWPVVAGVWVWARWSRRGWDLVAPGMFPLPRGLFSVEGVGVFFGGHKNNPRALTWKVDGVGVHFMLTNSIHPGVTVALPAAPEVP